MKFEPKTYQEIVELANGIEIAGEDKKNAKFSMRIAQNKYALKKHVDHLKDASEVPEEIQELEKKKGEIYNKYAVTKEGKAVIPDDKFAEFKAEVDQLKEESKDIQDSFDEQMKSYKALLKDKPTIADDEPLIIDMVEIPESMIPSTLTGNQIAAIFPLIKFSNA